MHPRFQESELSEPDRKVLSNIREYGWHVVLVSGEGDDPGWAFTVGLRESFDQPECAVFGLRQETAHAILNDLGERARAGTPLAATDEDADLLRGLTCALRPVLKRWFRPFFGSATWFYGSEDYEVLQVFWPDREDRLPWSPGFDGELDGIQPLLFSDPLPPNRLDAWIANS